MTDGTSPRVAETVAPDPRRALAGVLSSLALEGMHPKPDTLDNLALYAAGKIDRAALERRLAS